MARPASGLGFLGSRPQALALATEALSAREEALATKNTNENWAGLMNERAILAERLRTSGQYADHDTVEKARFEIQMADAILAKRPAAKSRLSLSIRSR